MKRHLILTLVLILVACSAPAPPATLLPTPTFTHTPISIPSLTPAPTATVTPTPTQTPVTGDVYVSAEYGLNLRAEPSTAATVFEILLFGTHLTAIDPPTAADAEGIAWQSVRTDVGQSGWVAAEYLSNTKPEAAIPDPFAPFTIEELRLRSYDSGPLEIVEMLEQNAAFTRYAIVYPSDGLRVTAMLNVPKGSGAPDEKFPVIILNHGYVDPGRFPTGSYIRAEADYLARSGYLTLSPDYRGHAGSEGNSEAAGPNVRGENTFRVAYAVDVLNLLHAVPGIPQADPDRIGMWGHSMGGGITLKVLTVDRGQSVDAAVLYGAMSGDEAANLHHIDRKWRPGLYDLMASTYGTPEERPEDYARLSPLTYVADITAPVSIHHGALDAEVPPAWSQDLAQRLGDAGKSVEYFEYAGAGHSLRGGDWSAFMQRIAAFFDQYVKGVSG
jgi:dienelactone hydrolase